MNHSIKTEMINANKVWSFGEFAIVQNKKKITKFKVIAMFSETSLDQQRKLSDRNRYFKVIKKSLDEICHLLGLQRVKLGVVPFTHRSQRGRP